MTILVFSDSHSSLRFMRMCIEAVRPDVMIHLGDYFDDGEAMKEEYPGIRLYQVPGNCDRYRCPPDQPEICIDRIGGVDVYLTHGCSLGGGDLLLHLGGLLSSARTANVDIVMYGHTHVADCHREEDGLWVLNPGSCGYSGGSAGIIEIQDGKIREVRLLREADLL